LIQLPFIKPHQENEVQTVTEKKMRKPKKVKHEAPHMQFTCNGIACPVVFHPNVDSIMAVKPVFDNPHSLHVKTVKKRTVFCMKNIKGSVYLFSLCWSPITGTLGMFSLLPPEPPTHVCFAKMWRDFQWHPFRLHSTDENVFATSHNGNSVSIKLTFCT
jgi:hypothetical protein